MYFCNLCIGLILYTCCNSS